MANDNSITPFPPEVKYDEQAGKFFISVFANRQAVEAAARDMIEREHAAVVRQQARNSPEVAALAKAAPAADTPQQREWRVRVAERELKRCELAIEQFQDGIDTYGDIRSLNAARDRAQAKLAEAEKIRETARVHGAAVDVARDAVWGAMNGSLAGLSERWQGEAAG
ncbi:MAG TPA: hypothetical protein VFW33_19335, partial [Gemmataceae bacterium]|nr:hypothetical protein [Gemmataceae bacterium]